MCVARRLLFLFADGCALCVVLCCLSVFVVRCLLFVDGCLLLCVVLCCSLVSVVRCFVGLFGVCSEPPWRCSSSVAYVYYCCMC